MHNHNFDVSRFILQFPDCTDSDVLEKYTQLLYQLFPAQRIFILLVDDIGELHIYAPDRSIQIENPDALLHLMLSGTDIVQTNELATKPYQGIFSEELQNTAGFFACSSIQSDIGRFLGCFGLLGDSNKQLLPDEKVFFQWVAENLALDLVGSKSGKNENFAALADLQAVMAPYLDDIFFLVDASAAIVVMPKQLPEHYKKFVFDRCGTLNAIFGNELTQQLVDLMSLTEMTQRKQTLVFQLAFRKLDYQYTVACNSLNEDWYLLTFHDVTERNRLRNQLEDRKRMLENILQASSIGVVVLQDDFKITYSNDTALRWLELNANNSELYLPQQHRRAGQNAEDDITPFVSLFSNKKPFTDIRYNFRQKNGKYKTFTVNAIYTAEHHGGRAVGTFYLIDVTERARLEQAMLDMDEQMRFMLQSSPVVIYQMLPGNDFELVYASPNIENIIGCRQSDVVNIPHCWRDHIHPDDRQRVLPQSDTGQKVYEYRFWFDHHNGYRWVKDIRRCLKTDTENGYIGALLDITERKEAEIRQAALQRDLELALAALVDAVITIDSKGDIVNFNPATCRLFGYEEKELTGQNVAILMPENMATLHNQFIDNYLHSGVGKIIGIGREVIARHKDGHEFPIALSIAPLSMDGGGQQRFVGCCHDLSLIKKQQEQLLHGERLSAVGRLTSSIAHDFNNILGIVRGYAEMLQGSEIKVAEYARHIIEASDRASDMIHQLLDFSSSKQRAVTVINLNQHLQKLKPLLEESVGAHIDVEFMLTDASMPLAVELNAFDNAMINMAVNAKYAMNGTGRLAISSSFCKDADIPKELGLGAGDYIRLSVADTGCGMTEEVRKHIFEPYFTTKGDKGTGLGLAQTFGLMKRCKGAIHVYSMPKKGSCFTLYFPVVKQAGQHAAETFDTNAQLNSVPVQPYQWSQSKVPDVKKGRSAATVLLVDDEDELRDMLATLLESSGYSVLAASSADRAIQLAATSPIDILLTDIMMPGKNGFELALHIKQLYPQTHIQLMSGYVDSKLIDSPQCEQWHAERLHKPIPLTELLRRLQQLLDDTRQNSPMNTT